MNKAAHSLLLILFVAAAQDPPPREGRILSIEGRRIAIDLGRADGMKTSQVLDVFSRPEYVRPPGSDKGVYIVEKQIAKIIVVEVQQDRCYGTISEGTGVEAGLRVVVSGSGSGSRKFTAPLIEERVEIRPKAEVACGESVEMEIRVTDLDGDFSHLEWEADTGRLKRSVTLDSKNVWTAPARAARASVKVTAVDRRGLRTSRTLSLSSTGRTPLEGELRLKIEATLAGASRHFAQARDIQFDAEGDAWILDGNTRRIVRLDSDFVPRWISSPHSRDTDYACFTRSAEGVFLIDRVSRKIHQYPADSGIFQEVPEKTFGGRGVLRTPVQIRGDSSNRLWVVDPGSKSVKVFAGSGKLLATLGSGSLFQDPVAVDFDSRGNAWVLDRGNRTLYEFRNFAFASEQKVTLRDPLVDFRIQPLTGDFLIATDRGLHRLRKSRVERLSHEVPYTDATRLAVDPSGRTYVLAREGASILRHDRAGRTAGYWGDDEFSDAVGMSVSDGEGVALWSRDTVWWLSPTGWILRKIALPEGTDVAACRLNDALWVLDRATSVALSYSKTPGAPRSVSLPEGTMQIAAVGDALAVLAPDGQAIFFYNSEGTETGSFELSPPAGGKARMDRGPDGSVTLIEGPLVRIIGRNGKETTRASMGRDAVSVTSDETEVFFYTDSNSRLWYFSRRLGRRVRIRLQRNSMYPSAVGMDSYRRLHVFDASRGRVLRFAVSAGE